MTKVRIIKPFVDKYNLSRVYCPGEEVLFDEERAARLIRLGLGEKADAEEVTSELKPDAADAPDAEEEVLPADEPSVAEEPEEKPKRKPRSKK